MNNFSILGTNEPFFTSLSNLGSEPTWEQAEQATRYLQAHRAAQTHHQF